MTKPTEPEIISGLNTKELADVSDIIDLLDRFIIEGLTGKRPIPYKRKVRWRYLNSTTTVPKKKT